jgi:1,2-diacylglycerol 3-beta-glucosyltransferase
MFFILNIFFACLYLLFAILVWWVLLRPWEKTKISEWPMVTVIVAGRNEADHLPACLQSLRNLSYPIEKLEIFLVDDASQDCSLSLLKAFAEHAFHVHVLTLTRAQKKLSGKAGAVLQAIEQSTGEFIFLTDADCRVPVHWLETHLAFFDKEVGMVGGITLLDQAQAGFGLFDRVQSLDWLFLLTVAAAACRIGKPMSWMGNNLAFRRSAYEQVGGYRALDNCLIEDFSLLNAISQLTSWRIVLHTNASALVQSRAEKNMTSLYQQRKRWALGVKPVRPLGKLLMAITFITHMLALASAVTLQSVGWFTVSAIVSADTLILFSSTIKIRRLDLLKFLLGFELFYFIFTLIMPIALLLDKKIIWKDDIYSY